MIDDKMPKKKTKEEFIEKAKEVHNNKYDYSKVEYVNNNTKVCIICTEHGEFWQTPHAHLSGKGCNECRNKILRNFKRSNITEFIKKSKQIHKKENYDYSNAKYVNSKTKVCIICPEHGEFWQMPYNHLKGCKCPKCVNNENSERLRYSAEYFKEKADEIHKGKYDYSMAKYDGSDKKVCIICPNHGEFWQTPQTHLRGSGCPKCANNYKLNTDTFIEKANKVHCGKYDYAKVNYINAYTKVCIICPNHGKFWQLPSSHLNGQGCAECGKLKIKEKLQSNAYEFIEKANKVHSGKYDYSKVEYTTAVNKICIVCPQHGEFWQRPSDHLTGYGCPKCSHTYSKNEDIICNLLKGVTYEQHNRTVLKGKELDVYIPSLKLGIEYNGLRWHSEEFGKGKQYHLDKLNKCEEQGIRLIQIFEDEWINHREICTSKLKQICGINTSPKIFGRKCKIREITKKNEAYDFLDKNHIQGRTVCTLALGAYYYDKLVGVMTFKLEKEGHWDLNRFATDINYQCLGIGGKLFHYFTKHYDFQEIKSFADRRWTSTLCDNLYVKLGFTEDKVLPPDYRYVVGEKRHHKFGFRKNTLIKKYGYEYKLNSSMTEREMCDIIGISRIWDCGLIKYVFRT